MPQAARNWQSCSVSPQASRGDLAFVLLPTAYCPLSPVLLLGSLPAALDRCQLLAASCSLSLDSMACADSIDSTDSTDPMDSMDSRNSTDSIS